MAHLETRLELFWLRLDELPVGRLVPGHEAFLGGLGLLELAAVLSGLGGGLGVLDHVLGRLRHHVTHVIKPLAAGPARDLVEVARREETCLVAVPLAELGEEHAADGHVHPNAQGVGAADDLEQPLLRQPLGQDPVLGQEPGVVEPDALLQPALEVGAVRRGEAEAFQGLRQGDLLLLGAKIKAREVLSIARRIGLGEVHHVNRRTPGTH